MITQSLIIDNIRADISNTDPIAVTYVVNDLGELKDRQSTYTQTIKLPKTATNKRIFGYSDSDSFTQLQPYRRLPCKLLCDGIEQISYGQISLQQVSDNFECQITFGLVGINDLLKVFDGLNIRDAKLRDLDWSDIPNFDFSLANIVASQSGTGVLWPIIDMGGTLDTSANIRISYLRPGVYVYDVINRIAKYIGYTFMGSILSNPQYITDFIPFTASKLFDYQGTDYYDTGLALSIVNNLPDISLKDFLKDMVQRFFLTPVVDNYKKTLVFKSFDELYKAKPIAKDWTDKFIDDSRADEFKFNSYAQVNYLRWEKDEEYLTIGDGILSVYNDNLKLNTTLLTSQFSASNYAVNVLGGINVASIHKFITAPGPSVYGASYDIETKPRIVNIRNKAGLYAISDINTTTYVNGIKIGFFSDQSGSGIGWDDNLVKFGTGLKSLLKKCRIITRYALLKPTDLVNFDFFIPVYDSREAKYYYVNEISNYVPGQKCKVNLVRM